MGETDLRVMSWVVGLGTVASGLSAAPGDRTDRPRTQITECRDLVKNLGAFGFQFGQEIWHVVSLLCLSVLQHSDIGAKNRDSNVLSLLCRAPLGHGLEQQRQLDSLDSLGIGIGDLHVIVRLGNDGYPYLYSQTRRSERSWSVSTGLLT